MRRLVVTAILLAGCSDTPSASFTTWVKVDGGGWAPCTEGEILWTPEGRYLPDLRAAALANDESFDEESLLSSFVDADTPVEGDRIGGDGSVCTFRSGAASVRVVGGYVDLSIPDVNDLAKLPAPTLDITAGDVAVSATASIRRTSDRAVFISDIAVPWLAVEPTDQLRIGIIPPGYLSAPEDQVFGLEAGEIVATLERCDDASPLQQNDLSAPDCAIAAAGGARILQLHAPRGIGKAITLTQQLLLPDGASVPIADEAISVRPTSDPDVVVAEKVIDVPDVGSTWVIAGKGVDSTGVVRQGPGIVVALNAPDLQIDVAGCEDACPVDAGALVDVALSVSQSLPEDVSVFEVVGGVRKATPTKVTLAQSTATGPYVGQLTLTAPLEAANWALVAELRDQTGRLIAVDEWSADLMNGSLDLSVSGCAGLMECAHGAGNVQATIDAPPGLTGAVTLIQRVDGAPFGTATSLTLPSSVPRRVSAMVAVPQVGGHWQIEVAPPPATARIDAASFGPIALIEPADALELTIAECNGTTPCTFGQGQGSVTVRLSSTSGLPSQVSLVEAVDGAQRGQTRVVNLRPTLQGQVAELLLPVPTSGRSWFLEARTQAGTAGQISRQQVLQLSDAVLDLIGGPCVAPQGTLGPDCAVYSGRGTFTLDVVVPIGFGATASVVQTVQDADGPEAQGTPLEVTLVPVGDGRTRRGSRTITVPDSTGLWTLSASVAREDGSLLTDAIDVGLEPPPQVALAWLPADIDPESLVPEDILSAPLLPRGADDLEACRTATLAAWIGGALDGDEVSLDVAGGTFPPGALRRVYALNATTTGLQDVILTELVTWPSSTSTRTVTGTLTTPFGDLSTNLSLSLSPPVANTLYPPASGVVQVGTTGSASVRIPGSLDAAVGGQAGAAQDVWVVVEASASDLATQLACPTVLTEQQLRCNRLGGPAGPVGGGCASGLPARVQTVPDGGYVLDIPAGICFAGTLTITTYARLVDDQAQCLGDPSSWSIQPAEAPVVLTYLPAPP